ncbi:MAG: cobalamin synthesis protein P47K [Bacteroidetes bacterium]|nr:cobalamin synthesis protein P47K [Bacteroidota bacterium]
MKTTRLILVGGFLGAGKTTLLWEAARRIMGNGQRVGLITNDQAPELVDTTILLHNNIKVAEVSGSCFCCNFDGLINAMQQVRKEANADVIIAEPVGSCTDLSATIVQPLKEKMEHELLVSPLSVLADPIHLNNILNGEMAGMHPSAAYIFLKQLEESDIILISKADLLKTADLTALKEKVKTRFPEAEVMTISAITGEGIDEWVKEVSNRTNAGQRLAEVDYDVYAEGEAVLGWLNSTIEISSEQTDWDAFAKNLMQDFSRQFDEMKAYVGHVKIVLESGEDYLIGNVTGKGDTLNFRGSAGTGSKARLTLNARVEMNPDTLEQIVRNTLNTKMTNNLTAKIVTLRCLSPGRPNPTFRFDHVVTN